MSLALKAVRGTSMAGVQEGGLFGSIFGGIKKVAGAVLPIAAGIIPGGGAISTGLSLFNRLKGRGGGASTGRSVAPVSLPRPGGGFPGPLNFAPPGAAARGTSVGFEAGTKLACVSGHHPNKSDYFLRSGEFVAAGTRCVRNRRRNSMNPRALDRAIGRVDGAKKIQHTLSHITTKKFTAAGNRKHDHG